MLFSKNNPENGKFWQLITTADGSQTLYNSVLSESYHSRFGAMQESNHVFINNGLRYLFEQNINQIRILEVGFGTGLNALLSLQFAIEKNILIHYTAIEAFPLPEAIILQLQYSKNFSPEYQNYFLQMHHAPTAKQIFIHPDFKFEILHKPLENCELLNDNYNLVYFDAFSPEVQPEMWTTTVFEKMFKCLANRGVLVTYCCKGLVKKNLRSVGFTIKRLPGALGKREMLRAEKYF